MTDRYPESLAAHHGYLVECLGEGRAASIGKDLVGIIAPLLARTPAPAGPCDVLVLHASPVPLSGVGTMLDRLREAGLRVSEERYPGWRSILARRLLAAPGEWVPASLRFKAAYAAFVAAKYSPRVLLTFMESDALCSLLRREVNRRGGKHVNCAHSITFPTPLFSMCDFDYYLLYGRGSLDALKENSHRFGNTLALMAGSVIYCGYRPIGPVRNWNRLVYFSSWFPRRDRSSYEMHFADVERLARDHPELQVDIKLHPLEQPNSWLARARRVPNIRVLPPSTDVPTALSNAAIALCNPASSSALDAALLGRVPLIYGSDYFGVQWYRRYPELNLGRTETLADAVSRIVKGYDVALDAARRFREYNLVAAPDGCQQIADAILKIARGMVPEGSVAV